MAALRAFRTAGASRIAGGALVHLGSQAATVDEIQLVPWNALDAWMEKRFS